MTVIIGPVADFAGETSRFYARYRRDLPGDQAARLALELGLRAEDVVVDLGCGTGQLAVPLRAHCAGVLGVDPEPGMLTGLRGRGVNGVMGVLGSDADLPQLRGFLGDLVGAVVVGNALHWMDEPAALRSAVELVRPGGGVAVVTQGPPLWLGSAPWQQRVRRVLEGQVGPVTGRCGSDVATQQARAAVLRDLGVAVQVITWRAEHPVDADWVVGHLGSALPRGAVGEDDPDGLAAKVRSALTGSGGLVEEVTTTVVVGRRPV